ncbi:IclR family transcriptional regulator domain-containing protein, partial [Brevibacterium aurantiacum]
QGPTTVKALNAILAQDRRAGWAIEHGEVTPGISTIAAPVYDVLSRPIAAIGLSLAGDVLTEDTDTEPLVNKVLAAAAEVTAKLR